jgi:RNA polymerase sigma-70 factor (family 1)
MTQHAPLYQEKAILLAVARGDAASFRQLFEAYKDKIYSYAMHYTHQEDAAEEVVQEVFMKVWLHRETLPFLEKFEAWVFTISRNLSFNYLRHLARQENLHRGITGLEEPAPDAADELLLAKEHASLLLAAVDRLPPRQKLIYTLHREQHHTLEDIAAELGLARSTVKSHLAQAMRSVRVYIKAYIEPGAALLLLFLPW